MLNVIASIAAYLISSGIKKKTKFTTSASTK